MAFKERRGWIMPWSLSEGLSFPAFGERFLVVCKRNRGTAKDGLSLYEGRVEVRPKRGQYRGQLLEGLAKNVIGQKYQPFSIFH